MSKEAVGFVHKVVELRTHVVQSVNTYSLKALGYVSPEKKAGYESARDAYADVRDRIDREFEDLLRRRS